MKGPLLFIFLLTLTLFITEKGMAQDKILLLNGNVINGSITDTNSIYVEYKKAKNNKPGKIEKYRVFSIVYPDGSETVHYKEDSLIGNYFTEHQMRMFLYGEQDAQKGYKAPLNFTGSILVGAASGFLFPFTITKNPNTPTESVTNISGFFMPIAPVIFCVFTGAKWIKMNRNTVSNKLYLSEETYVRGYDRVARNKRIQNAMLGSLAGMAVGILVKSVTDTNVNFNRH